MVALKNDRLMKALAREPIDTTPVWIMRQAGRYLPEYRATRARAGSFMKLCKTPELACEVTLQPLQRYDLDAAIIFSDILTIPDAMGLGLTFVEGDGPRFEYTVRDEKSLYRLGELDLSRLEYVYTALKLVRHELSDRIPLIGFCGSPFTLAAYMIEGQSKSGFPFLFKMLDENPILLHRLLDLLARSISAHLNAQIEAGAQVVMIFDTWGGLLGKNYEEFSLFYLKEIIYKLKYQYNVTLPIILFTKGGSEFLEQMASSGCHALGVDWQITLYEARRRVGNKVALQGNLNPACLLESPISIEQEVERTLASFGPGSGHVFNLGHGITPDVPPEHVAILIDAVHKLSKSYHQTNSK